MEGNRLCDECGLKNADYFCSCTDLETFLCKKHIKKHMLKMSGKEHQMRLLSLLLNYKSPRYLKRRETFSAVFEEADGVGKEVDRAMEEVSIKVEGIRAALNTLYADKMQELQKIKDNLARDVPIALKEVERTLGEEHPRLTALYASLIRDCIDLPAPLRLFTFSVSSCEPEALLRVSTHLAAPKRLAGVWMNKAFLYEVQSQELTQHTVSVNFDQGGSFIECDKDTLMCIGGPQVTSAVYSLSLSSFQLSPLPSLVTPRSYAGLAKVNTQFYVFGGYIPATSTCEKIQLSENHWTPVSNMIHPRHTFAPSSTSFLLALPK